jgi:hypothetical protein
MRAKARLTAFALALTVAGCAAQAARLPTAPAEGKVLYKGKPADGAQVVLVPVGDDSPDAVKPRGTADRNGVFKLTTYPGADGKADGAPAGEYLVSVRWTKRQRESAADADEGGPPGPPSLQGDRLKERYSNPKNSGLKVTIDAAGKLDPPVFDLK